MKPPRYMLLSFYVTASAYVHGQGLDESITVFSEVSPSTVQQVYYDTLVDGLRGAGFSVRNVAEPILVPRGELRTVVMESGAAIGLSLLQNYVGEQDSAAALLSSPGSFTTLADNRTAQRGVIGDMARDEVAQEGLLALRLWSHSTAALVSNAVLASVDDFSGVKVITGDPYSIAFVKALGGLSVPISFAEIYNALQTGVASTAVLPQELLNDPFLEPVQDGSFVSEYKIGVGVTFASAQWWKSLPAPSQQAVIDVLHQAELSSGSALQAQIDQTIGLSEKNGYRAVSWDFFTRDDVQRAVGAAVSTRVGEEEAKSILELRDEMMELEREGASDGIEHDEFEPEGTLNSGTRVFFASDRRFDLDAGVLSDSFSNSEDPDEVVRCGELVPSRAGRFGEVSELPMLVEGTRLYQMADCTALISEALKGKDERLLVYIHGYTPSVRIVAASH